MLLLLQLEWLLLLLLLLMVKGRRWGCAVGVVAAAAVDGGEFAEQRWIQVGRRGVGWTTQQATGSVKDTIQS